MFLSIPLSGKVTVSNPIPQATAGFVHPLISFVRVPKTYETELLSPITASVMILAKKNPTWKMHPAVSSKVMNRGSQKLPRNGTIVTAHIINVECHRCGSYCGLLNDARPTMMLEMMAGFDVQEHIQANTVIQPCNRPKKRFHRGAKAADQRYCAPTVGSMEDISASDKATRVVPNPAKMVP
jgi:hypothetical protein